MIELIIGLAVLGLIWWLVDTYIPIAEPFKTIIRVLIVILLIVWILNFFGFVNIPLRMRS